MMEFTLVRLVLLFCAIVTLVTFVYIYCRYNLKYWKRRGVPQLSNTHWFFGNFKDAVLFRSAPGWHLKKLYEEYDGLSPFFGFYILQKPCLQLKDPDLIKQMFIKDFAVFPDRYFSGKREKDSIGMRNLFGMRNPQWKNLRRKISLTFTTQKLKKMLPLMLENGRPMMEYIDSLKADEMGIKNIDGQDLNCKYATDIIANVVIGLRVDSFNNPDTEFTKSTEEFFHSIKRLRAMISVFFLQGLVDLIGPIIYYDMTYFKRLFRAAVKMREETGITRGDYMDSVVKLKNGQQDPDYVFDNENLLDQSAHFLSGFESGSTASAFTLMELAKNQEVQRRAREDITRAVQKFGWTYEGFQEMKFLDQCVMEGLRMYPPVPFLDRRARENYKIPGTDVMIEKGSGVYVAISALNRDPKYFSNPDVYDPDRFGSGSTKVDAFLPFGIGPKVCIGSKLGMLHVKVVLSLLLNEYEVTYHRKDKDILDPRATFTLADKGLMMQIKKLNK